MKSNAPTRVQTLDALFSAWNPAPPEAEELPLEAAAGRVLARDMYALLDLPVVRASMMDGVCVASARFAAGVPDASAWKRGVDYDRADTGDDFDDAFDAVIPIEQVSFGPDGALTLSPEGPVTPGLHVRPRGKMCIRDRDVDREPAHQSHLVSVSAACSIRPIRV